MTKAEYYKELQAIGGLPAAQQDKALRALELKVKEAMTNKSSEFTLADVQQLYALNPVLAQERAAEAAQAKRAGNIATGLDLLYTGAQMAASQSQIARSKNAASQIRQPGLPGVAPSNPQLAAALNQAQLGTVNVNDILRPAQQGIQDAYRGALNQAQVASGGQAGAYQGMANLANLQRMRAQLGLAPIAQEAKLQNQGVYNQLLAQKLAETQNQFENRSTNAQLALDQYDKDAMAIGGLGSAGRTNLLNAGQRLTQNLQGVAPYLGGFQQQPQPSTYDIVQSRVNARLNDPNRLRSSIPEIGIPELKAFSDRAAMENMYRSNGANSQYLDTKVNPALRFKDPNYNYGY